MFKKSTLIIFEIAGEDILSGELVMIGKNGKINNIKKFKKTKCQKKTKK